MCHKKFWFSCQLFSYSWCLTHDAWYLHSSKDDSTCPLTGRRQHHVTEREFGRWIRMTGAVRAGGNLRSLFLQVLCIYMIHWYWECCHKWWRVFFLSCLKMLPESPALYKWIQCGKYELHRKVFFVEQATSWFWSWDGFDPLWPVFNT